MEPVPHPVGGCTSSRDENCARLQIKCDEDLFGYRRDGVFIVFKNQALPARR
jgi:hypothetical protein